MSIIIYSNNDKATLNKKYNIPENLLNYPILIYNNDIFVYDYESSNVQSIAKDLSMILKMDIISHEKQKIKYIVPTVICMNISYLKTKKEKDDKTSFLIDGLKNNTLIYIGRPNTGNGFWNSKLKEISKTIPTLFDWQNPYSAKEYGLDTALSLYENYINNNDKLLERLSELSGKQLVCWCVKKGDEPCHGKILAKLFEEKLIN